MTKQDRPLSGLKYLMLALISLVAIGCGSDNDGINQATGQQNTGGGVAFVGQYLGANNVSNNQPATLTVNTKSNGTATGTLQVAAVNPQTSVVVGTYDLTGTFDLSTGTFSLTGNIPPTGPFTITGTFPVGSAVGSYTFSFNGLTFPGAIQAASQGVPAVPSNPNDGDSKLISGGTLSNFVFTPSGGYNGEDPPVTASSLISGASGPGQNGESSLTMALSETVLMGQTASVRTFVISVVDPSGDPIEAGDSFSLASGNPPSGAVIALSQSEGTTVLDGWSLVQGTTGSVDIVAISDTSVTIDFDFTNVGPNSEIANNPSTGSFATSGRLVGNFVTLP